MIALEPRIMFDGAAVDTAIHDVIDVKPPVQDTHVAEDTAKLLQALADVKPPVQIQAADPTQTDGKREVAFIDTSVSDWQALANGMQKGVEIELIDGNQSGLAQMVKWAETHNHYDAVHVFSQGGEAKE